MYRITSLKRNVSALSDLNGSVSFHNRLFNTDDCIIEYIETDIAASEDFHRVLPVPDEIGEQDVIP